MRLNASVDDLMSPSRAHRHRRALMHRSTSSHALLMAASAQVNLHSTPGKKARGTKRAVQPGTTASPIKRRHTFMDIVTDVANAKVVSASHAF